MKKLLPSCVLLLMGATCFHGEGDRQVVHQTKEAGSFIEQNPASPPEVKQAGADVRSNMETLQPTVGVPGQPRPYSPAASADARRQSVEERDQPPAFVRWIAKVASPIAPWAAPAILGAWGLIAEIAKRKNRDKLVAVYQGLENVKSEIGRGSTLTPDGIVEIMRTVASAHNVYKDIKADLSKLKEKGVVSEPKRDEIPTPGEQNRA